MALDWKGVRLSVENPLIQRQKTIIREDQVKILQCFSQEEALLNIIFLWIALVDITKTGVTTIRAAVLFQGLMGQTTRVIYQWDSNTKVICQWDI